MSGKQFFLSLFLWSLLSWNVCILNIFQILLGLILLLGKMATSRSYNHFRVLNFNVTMWKEDILWKYRGKPRSNYDVPRSINKRLRGINSSAKGFSNELTASVFLLVTESEESAALSSSFLAFCHSQSCVSNSSSNMASMHSFINSSSSRRCNSLKKN